MQYAKPIKRGDRSRNIFGAVIDIVGNAYRMDARKS
jgi:hypothetical protein